MPTNSGDPEISIQPIISPLVANPCQNVEIIPLPTLHYQLTTRKIDIESIPDRSNVDSISDGFQTVTFSTTMNRRQVPTSWATWAPPPFSENSTPPVLFTSGATSLTLSLSQAVHTFGFEFEPNPFGQFAVSVIYLSDGVPIFSLDRIVEGEGGDQLFAIKIPNTCSRITEVQIISEVDFAIAQIRYAILPNPPGPSQGPRNIRLTECDVRKLRRKRRKFPFQM